ncbi:TolC family protein [Dyadobacter sp. OTU695]|uniref:TolC family protein n=1 Tax=Dyadobacter sp. OTU695 TaxID=3043860 RepID=UPI00313D626E
MNLKNNLKIASVLLFSLSAVVAQDAASPSGWTLEQCLQYAADHNKELNVARQQTTLAATSSGQAKAKLLPTVTGTASLDHYWQIPVQVFPGELAGQPQGTFVPVRLGTPWMGNAGVQADLTLIDAATWKQIKTARLQQQLSASQGASIQKLVGKNVQMAFYSALLNKEELALAEARLKDFAESHRLVALNFEKGITDQIALNQSLALQEDLRDEAGRIQASYQQSMLDLKFWMGFPITDSLPLTAARTPAPDVTLSGSFRPGFLPDFASDSLAVEIAIAAQRRSRAALYPKISLVSGYTRLGFGSEVSFITQSKWFSSGYVGLRLSVPVFDLSRMSYQLKKDKQSTLVALAERDAHIASSNKAFASAKIAYDRARQELASLETKQKLAEENISLSTKKLQKGIIDMIALKEFQDELTLIRQKRFAAELQGLIQIVELDYLQGN